MSVWTCRIVLFPVSLFLSLVPLLEQLGEDRSSLRILNHYIAVDLQNIGPGCGKLKQSRWTVGLIQRTSAA